jgi:hypothetical protein
MSIPFYIQLDADGNPIGNPVMAQNLTELLGSEVTPESAETLNYVPIAENAPTLTYSQTCTYDGWSRKEDGSFSMNYVITELSQEEVLSAVIRGRRNFELSASDWTQIPDSPLSAKDKAAWGTYRQTLRDLTTAYANLTSADAVVWPKRPGEPDYVSPPAPTEL